MAEVLNKSKTVFSVNSSNRRKPPSTHPKCAYYNTNRGYYMPAHGYEFYLRVVAGKLTWYFTGVYKL